MTTPLLIGAAALLMIITSVPLILRRIPKNQFYGLRTTRTMNGTDAEWYEANRKAGFALSGAGVLTLIVCLIAALTGPVHLAGKVVLTATLLSTLFGALFLSTRGGQG